MLGPGNAGWTDPVGTPRGALGDCWAPLRCLPSSLGTGQGNGCVHTGGDAGMWEEPAARPQMVALPTSAASLPSSRRGSVEKVGEAGVPCARVRL